MASSALVWRWKKAVTGLRLDERIIVPELMNLYLRQALAHREQAAPRWRAACAG